MQSESRFRRIKAEIRRRSLPALGLRVLQRWAATRPKGSVMIATSARTSSSDRGSTDTPAENESMTQRSRLWLDAPLRWRYEFEVPGGRTGVFVRDGPLWWSYAPGSNAWSNESAPDRYPAQTEHQESQLFHPEEILAALTVTSSRTEQREGRSIDVIEGVAWDDVPLSPPGADTYHLVIDRERDVALRVAARADGIEFSSVELTSLEFDVPMDPSLFRIELPAGLAFTPPPSHMPRPSILRRVLGRLHLGPRR